MARAGLVYGLMRAGSREEAMTAAKDLIIAADTLPNPWAHSYALLTYGIAWCDADPLGARDALQRGLVMAQESGNRYNESRLANILGRLEAKHGDEAAALQYLARAIRNYHDSVNTVVIRVPLTVLAALLGRLGRLGRQESAATIAGFAFGHLSRA
jgi:tetratricopeptide (TPR) repeat protein